MEDAATVQQRFHAAGHDQRGRSTLYSHLNRQIADDPDVASLLLAAPPRQRLPVLLLAAVHSIVLDDPTAELASWYPTATESPRSDDAYPAFRRLCLERGEQIREIVAGRSVQTNEVGRCSLLLPALAGIEPELDGALRLIDVGASAGLNLLLDRFEYRYEPGGSVGPSSKVVLRCGIRGKIRIPPRCPRLADRLGIDRDPIDTSDADARRWLLACIWPDQPDRFERLRGALELADEQPPPVVRGDALADTTHHAATTPDDMHPVITNSWVLNYLTEPDQRAYATKLDEFGRSRDLTWIFAESPGLCPGLPVPRHLQGLHTTVVMLVRWRKGVRSERHIGTGHPHGYWLHAPTDQF